MSHYYEPIGGVETADVEMVKYRYHIERMRYYEYKCHKYAHHKKRYKKYYKRYCYHRKMYEHYCKKGYQLYHGYHQPYGYHQYHDYNQHQGYPVAQENCHHCPKKHEKRYESSSS